MNLSVRYVAAELARNFVIMALAMIVLFDLIAFLTEAEDIGDASYDVLDALIVVAYSSPALLVDLSPFVIMMGTLAAFANLDARSEITALRAAGVSRGWFLTTTMATSAVAMLLVAGVELVARPAHLEASLLRMYETATTGNPLKDGGFWTRSGTTYVNVEGIENAQRPTGIRIFEFDEGGAITDFIQAQSAAVESRDAWQLQNVVTKRYVHGAPEQLVTAEREQWVPIWPSENAIYSLTVSSLSIADLIGDSFNGGADGLTDSIELWRRLSLPLAAIAYAAFACAFALSLRGRGGKAARLALGAAAALALYLTEQLSVNAGILAGIPVALVSILPSVVVIGIAAALLRRAP